jgi:hypothetical protein
MVCPPATSEAEARWPRFGLVVVATYGRRDNKDKMIRPYDSLTSWTLCARPLARQMQLLRKYTLLHAGAATRRYTPEKLLLSSLLSLAGAINNVFMVYP